MLNLHPCKQKNTTKREGFQYLISMFNPLFADDRTLSRDQLHFWEEWREWLLLDDSIRVGTCVFKYAVDLMALQVRFYNMLLINSHIFIVIYRQDYHSSHFRPLQEQEYFILSNTWKKKKKKDNWKPNKILTLL